MKINPQDYIGKAIFITATNTNVGKTFASEVFLQVQTFLDHQVASYL